MDIKDISDLISSVGFPIVVAILMIWQNQQQEQRNYNIIQELQVLIENNTKIVETYVQMRESQLIDSMKKVGLNTAEINTILPEMKGTNNGQNKTQA